MSACASTPDPVQPEYQHWSSPVLYPDKMMRRVGCSLCGTTDVCRVNPPHWNSGLFEKQTANEAPVYVPDDWSPLA